MEEHKHDCGCGCEDDDMEMSTEEIVEENNVVLNTLIDLLIEKGIISEDELLEKLNAADAELDSEDDEEEDLEEE